MDFIEVGQVLKPQGIKGELKIKPLTDDAFRFRKLRSVYFDDVCYRLISCRISDYVYLKLEGVDNRNDAEKFVGKYVRIDRIHAIVPEEGSYFISDLLGSELIDESGNTMGVITDIDSYGAADVVTAENSDGKVFRFPFLKRLLHDVDTGNKKVYVKREDTEAVSVYED